jgi:outer membrane protein
MKHILISLLCAAALALPAQAQNAPVILVVDVGAVFNGSSEAQAAQLKFTSAVEAANKEITAKIQDATAVAKDAQDLNSKANDPALTPDARAQYQKDLDVKKKQFDDAQQEIAGFKQSMEQELQDRRQTIVQTQFDAIKVVVIDIAKKRRASLVLNSSGLSVVYFDPSMDITKDVLAVLNAGAAATTATTPAAAN